MAQSSTLGKAWSVLSYHDAIWQTSWGDTSVIAALRDEMAQAVRHDNTWLSKSPHQPQLPGLQAVGLMMTTIAGTKCQVPAIVFAAQAQNSNAQAYLQTAATASETRLGQKPPLDSKRTDSDPNLLVDGSWPSVAKSRVPEESNDQVPPQPDFDGELPSVGSEGHFDGSCKRCAFFPKGRCKNGKDCSHCHFSHELRPRNRKRGAVGARRRTGAITEDEALEDVDAEDVCLSEVLAYLSEPAGESPVSGHVEVNKRRHQFNDSLESRDSIVTKLNHAIQEVAEIYKNDAGDCTTYDAAKDVELEAASRDRDIVDADTTSSSVSALSDGEDAATTSFADSEKMNELRMKEDAPFDASDSESSSLHDVANQLPQSDQGPEKCHHPVLSSKCSDSPSSHQVSNKPPAMDTLRMARSLLNKLTQERFESLCSQILSLPLSTPEQLAVVVAEIFHKATTQDCFRKLYTELCMRLDAHLATSTGEVGGKAFRKALVNECQATFERNLQPPDPALVAGLDDDERFEVEMKLKTRRLGNMRFIGDLLVRRLLAPKLLSPIVHELLNGDEASLESLVALLSVVAPEFENKPVLYHAPVRDAMASLRQKINENSLCPRMCFQIKDLMDAKARGWRPRSPAP